MTDYRTTRVPVRGGNLTVGEWGPSNGPAILVVHGVTASHLTWPLLASLLPDAHLIAPDLRGRGRSNELPGPWGMPQHADDLAAVLETFGVSSAVVVGHSMGAFAALVFAHRHPHLVESLVLVDGGLPLATPAGLSDDEATRAILGPAAERLSMTFESRESYREFWKKHPAFANDWSALIEDYLNYDLVGVEPNLRPSTSYDAVAADSIELRGGDSLLRALDDLAHPVTFIFAPRGLMNETPPLYPQDAIDRWKEQLPGIVTLAAEDVNHYTIVMADDGARMVANTIRAALNDSGSATRSADRAQEKVERA
ncbi:MAG: alpha/beta hydrolase [Microbacteriaceae bacterium]|nr:alpha/beta hydrolase [Microbacteriaceae bacterium]